MGNYELLVSIVSGSLRDPILWIVAAIFGWDSERRLMQTLQFLLAAGFIWGCIRVAVYSSFGTELSTVQGLVILTVCVGLMTLVGGAIRLGRGHFKKDTGSRL